MNKIEKSIQQGFEENNQEKLTRRKLDKKAAHFREIARLKKLIDSTKEYTFNNNE